MTGRSHTLDPATDAFRADIADVALAGRIIASHYAEPVERVCARATALTTEPEGNGDVVAEMREGDKFALLDCHRGHAWGYSVADHLVGYVDQAALG